MHFLSAKKGKGKGRLRYLSRYYEGETDEIQRTSWFVPMIVVANVGVFIVSIYLTNCPQYNLGYCVPNFFGRFSFQPFDQYPALGPSSRTLDKMGALEWNKVVDKHQWWRLLTCIWLHAGLLDLLANMICVLLTGIRLEQLFGFARVGVIYLLSGMGGNICSLLLGQHHIYVGASSPLFGLLGAMLSEIITNWTVYIDRVAALFTIVLFVTLSLTVGRFLPHVDSFGHIGGFFTGFLMGFILLLRAQSLWHVGQNFFPSGLLKPKIRVHQYILACVALLLLIVWFVVGLVLVFKGLSASP